MGGVFPKDKRFAESLSETSDLDYNPNFNCKYKKAPGTIIKREETREALKQRRKDKLRMMLPELTTSEKVNFSILTADTEAAVPGPGAYTVTYSGIEVTRHVGLSKASRFESQKKDDSMSLEIRYNQVEVNTKGVKILPPVAIGDKLIRKRQLEAAAEENRARAELEALKDKEKREKDRILKEVKVERQKTEKERLMELFRLVLYADVA